MVVFTRVLSAQQNRDLDEHGNVVAQVARFRVQGGRFVDVDGSFVDVDRFDRIKSAACPQVQHRAEGK